MRCTRRPAAAACCRTRDIDRKRVTLLYRPIDAGARGADRRGRQAQRGLPRELRRARPSARADGRAARRRRDGRAEEARGAGLVELRHGGHGHGRRAPSGSTRHGARSTTWRRRRASCSARATARRTPRSPPRCRWASCCRATCGAGRGCESRCEARAGRQAGAARCERVPRGWPGRGGGESTYVQAAAEWRGTTVQVCGLWPFAAGTGSPMVGVPIGRNLAVRRDAVLRPDQLVHARQADLEPVDVRARQAGSGQVDAHPADGARPGRATASCRWCWATSSPTTWT